MPFDDPLVLASPTSLAHFTREYLGESLPAMLVRLDAAYDDGIMVEAPTIYDTPPLTPRQWPWMAVVSDRHLFSIYEGTERQYEGNIIAFLEVSTNREVIGDYDPDSVLHNLAERTVWAVARALDEDHTMGGRVEHARYMESVLPSVFESQIINRIAEGDAQQSLPSTYTRRAAIVLQVEQSDR